MGALRTASRVTIGLRPAISVATSGYRRRMEHRFSGTPFTIGIEEELMLVDAASFELAQGIEAILADCERRASARSSRS